MGCCEVISALTVTVMNAQRVILALNAGIVELPMIHSNDSLQKGLN